MKENEKTFKSILNVSGNVTASNKNGVVNSDIVGSGSEMDSYFCKICELGLPSSDALNNHLHSLHAIKISRDCFACGCHPCAEIFQTSAMLTDHLRREHTVQKFNSCSRCGKKFACSYSVPTHCSSDLPSKIYCNICIIELKTVKDEGVNNNDENTLKQVPNVVLSMNRYNKNQSKIAWNDGPTKSCVCQICQLEFSSSEALDDHLLSLHVVTRFSCGSCKEEFETLEMSMNHLRRDHTVQNINICRQCGEKLTCSLSLPSDRGFMKSLKIYCDRCRREYETENNRNREVKIEENVIENSLESNDDVSDGNSSRDTDGDGLNCASSDDDDDETDSYFCQICRHSLSSSDALDDHLCSLHVIRGGRGCFSCSSCKKELKSLASLKNHLRRDHTVIKIYSCSQCGKKLAKCHSVATPGRRKGSPQIYCDLCVGEHENAKRKASKENECGQDGDNELTDEDLSATHVIDGKDNIKTLKSRNLKNRKKRLVCAFCSKKFWTRELLLYHEHNTCRGNAYICHVCSKSYSSADNLRRHTLIHSGTKPYLCDECGTAFSQKQTLTVHQRRFHTGGTLNDSTPEKPYVCDICQRGFVMKYMVLEHRRIHTGERPFSCRFCDKKYRSKSALIEHCRKHDNKKFACDICPKVYSNRAGLYNHRRIHTGEKPYTCEICNKTFANSNSRRVHMDIHSGVKPFTCDACGKGFTQKPHLKSHLRVHTGEKPYECDICRQAFSHKGTLISHRRIHTGERPYHCDVCQKDFIDKGQLNKHKRTHDKR